LSFRDFFHQATGYAPFPYQESLANADMTRLALAAPTGSGKTAAATLAWLWQRQHHPETNPTRLVLCEPQRTLVEQVYQEVAKWLKNLGLNQQITVHPMQGGYVDQDWELHPEQPAIIVGTQDQLLSRALNRGYAMSRFRWPVHFGLLNNDVQWVFDELQLMGPGLETSAQLHGLREKLGVQGTARTLWMSATLHPDWLSTVDHTVDDGARNLPIHPFTAEDKAVEEMAARLNAKKPLRQLLIDIDAKYGDSLAKEVLRLHQPGRFTLIILNTVKRARELHGKLTKKLGPDKLFLLHSRFRPEDRARILNAVLEGQGEKVVISTQVVEAGVDISADLLITELAPKSSMIQRFGRCNRKGRQDHAEVYWIDLPEKTAPPYEWEDLKASSQLFQTLESVQPARFEDPLDEPRPLYDTLRRRDLLDLFDTSSDLSGLDLDVSRFIRDGDNRDVFLFWRDWGGGKPSLALPAPGHAELCKVGKFEAAKLVADGKLKLWQLDDPSEKVTQWRPARQSDLVSGRTYLAHVNEGHYSAQTGWSPGSKGPVEDLKDAESSSPFPAMSGDSLSEKFECYLTLWQHTSNVCLELEAIFPGLRRHLSPTLLGQLRQAALWHDVGKAHPIFQETMKKHSDPAKVDPVELWAKRIGSAYHSRRYFRHELASALAARAHGLDFLTQYLIASHHGKARLSIRPFPDEQDNAILGIIDGEQLPAINFPGHQKAIEPLTLPATTLHLNPFELGRGSWQDQALALRDHQQLGPFRLAYLEALLRAADVRASIKEKKGPLVRA
jgi:CRISPR-associated endonuclease/helicase Cas3